MFKKLCVVFLSVCIATAMILGIGTCVPKNNEQNTPALCNMDFDEVSC